MLENLNLLKTDLVVTTFPNDQLSKVPVIKTNPKLTSAKKPSLTVNTDKAQASPKNLGCFDQQLDTLYKQIKSNLN